MNGHELCHCVTAATGPLLVSGGAGPFATSRHTAFSGAKLNACRTLILCYMHYYMV